MKIDIEVLIAAKRAERQKRLQAQNDSELERFERRIQRQKENAEQVEKRLREHAELLSNCLAKYSPIRLHNWFLLDNWTVPDGLILLSGFDPKNVPLNERGEVVIPHLWSDTLHGKTSQERFVLSRIRRLDNLPIFAELTVEILGEDYVNMISNDFMLLHTKALRIWNSGTHNELRYPPKYFIDWAISKKMPIDWLEWVKAEGYYGDQSTAEEKPLAPRARNNYLGIIGALADLYWKTTYPGQDFKHAKVLEDLLPYTGFPGLTESQTHLKNTLTQAMNLIDQK